MKEVIDPFSDLIKEINFDKNPELDITSLTVGMSQTIWWECKLGHSWLARINVRAKGGKAGECPYCNNRKLLVGFNDLITTHPVLASEWHPTKNGLSKPSDFTQIKHQKVWWIGTACRHEWESPIHKRALLDRGCHYCVNQIVLKGFNDLLTLNPKLAAEWHPTMNGLHKPDQVLAGSSKFFYWICELEHSWKASPSYRGSTKGLKNGCPICSDKIFLQGFNDLATRCPELAAEWHPTKNGLSQPSNFTFRERAYFWWICKKEHEWSATIRNRYYNKTNCMECQANSYTSKAEFKIRELLTSKSISFISPERQLLGSNREIDIYLPEQKIGIEYNGIFWHSDRFKSKYYHNKKYSDSKVLGIHLVQIWENDWHEDEQLIKEKLLSLISPQFLLNYSIKVNSNATSYILINFAGKVIEKITLTIEAKYILIKNHTILNYTSNGLELLIQEIEKHHLDKIIKSSTDNCWSIDEQRYIEAGFSIYGSSEPKSQTVKGKKLIPFEESREGMPILWDAGRTLWIKTQTN